MSVRVHELAKKLKISSKELLEKLKKMKVEAKSHASAIDDEVAARITRELREKQKPAAEIKKPSEKVQEKHHKEKTVKKTAPVPQKTHAKPVEKVSASPTHKAPAPAHKKDPVKIEKVVPRPAVAKAAPASVPVAPKPQAAPPKEVPPAPKKKVVLKVPISVRDLATKISFKPSELMKELFKIKMMATINQVLEKESVQKLLAHLGFELEEAPSLEQEILKKHEPSRGPNAKPRAPVVTLMGHVDHGKTSLLDRIRQSQITATESGGITQHIGAYKVKTQFGTITFLDTPGHEAFTAMRARGANITDIVILVIAADDGVMPQTIEAVDHARAADVPIIVAINKIDAPGADIDKVKKQLAQMNLLAEDWGGKVIMAGVSAKTGEGIPHLLEMLLLEAELLELKADPVRSASGIVLEGKLSKAKGPLATVLVQEGTLKTNDIMVVGDCYGKIKAMVNDFNQPCDMIGPSEPVEVLGLSGVPQAGDRFFVVEDEKRAKELAAQRQHEKRIRKLENLPKKAHMSLELLSQDARQQGLIKELRLVLKADAQGSVEAIKDSLLKIVSEKIKIAFLHTGVGAINGSDVMLASASDAIIVGFHVDVAPEAKELASEENVEIRFYRIIYDLIEEVKKAMIGMLEPEKELIFAGRAVVKQVFDLSRAGKIAGCQVAKGKISRQDTFRVIRDKEKIFEGKVNSLKRFKNDVRDVAEGFECGIKLEGFNAFEVGDLIEAYTLKMTQGEL